MEVESSLRSILLLGLVIFVGWMPFPWPICHGGLGLGSIISVCTLVSLPSCGGRSSLCGSMSLPLVCFS